MIQRQVFWQQEMPSRNIHLSSASVPMQGIAKRLNRMSPVNWALELIFQYALNPGGRSCPSGGSLGALWPGSTIPAVFPKIMRCLSVLPRLFALFPLFVLCSKGFSLLVQFLRCIISTILTITMDYVRQSLRTLIFIITTAIRKILVV